MFITLSAAWHLIFLIVTISFLFFFFLNDPAPTEISPLSLHDALPIFKAPPAVLFAADCAAPLHPNVLVLRIQPDEGISIRMNAKVPGTALNIQPVKMDFHGLRSEEHTSELQSLAYLVCRLLLEKKKK